MKCRDCPATTPGNATATWARGLCRKCYHRHYNTGTLDQFPRRTNRRADVIEDWLFLKKQNLTNRQIAERMDMKRDALERALARARHDGDPQLLGRWVA